MPLGRVDLDEVVEVLRDAGAVFAYLHGSAASGTGRSDSDVDVAAYFDGRDPAPWTIRVPGLVDVAVLDSAPLELAGRVALHGRLLFDDDPPTRVHWEATTRKIFLDERDRAARMTADLIAGAREAVSRRGHG
jgi:predicted nucleotidyltransferase